MRWPRCCQHPPIEFERMRAIQKQAFEEAVNQFVETIKLYGMSVTRIDSPHIESFVMLTSSGLIHINAIPSSKDEYDREMFEWKAYIEKCGDIVCFHNHRAPTKKEE